MTATFEVRLTKAAKRDLESIVEGARLYRSVQAADALLAELLDGVVSLEALPERGSIPAELGALGITAFRQLVVHPYRLIYRVIETTVFVMVIADGRQDMQALLERRLLEH